MKALTASFRSAFLGLFLLASSLHSHGADYFQDFSDYYNQSTFFDGSRLLSTGTNVAKVINSTLTELQLTAYGTNSTITVFAITNLTSTGRVHAFSAKWNAEIYGDFPNAADGFSFNFGPMQVGTNLLSGSVESGYSNALSFSVQTYNNNSPGFYIRVNGSTVASSAFVPATRLGVTNTSRHFFEVDWHYLNGMSARMDGQSIFLNVPTGNFVTKAGDSFVFAARTGGLNQRVALDNILITPGGNLTQIAMGAPYFTDYTNAVNPVTHAFDGNSSTKWSTAFNSGSVGATPVSGARAVRACALTVPGDSAASDPTSWVLGGSTNGGTNWSYFAQMYPRWVNRFETRPWLASTTNAFGAYQLAIGSSGIGAGAHLADLRLYEFVPVTARDFSSVSLTGVPGIYDGDVAWGDYDNDGDLDFLATGRTNSSSDGVIQVWRNNGDSTFTRNTSLDTAGLPGAYWSACAWNDYDRDGDLDFAYGGWGPGPTTRLVRNNGNGTFSADFTTSLPGTSLGSLAWGDYDKDGDSDLLITGYYQGTTEITHIWRNNGNGTFTQDTRTTFPGVDQSSANWVDYDNDGALDLFVTGRLGIQALTQLWRNSGNGTFTQNTNTGLPHIQGEHAWGDYDNDGRLDVLLSGLNDETGALTQLWRNNGNGTFTHNTNAGFNNLHSGTVDWGDYNNDGRLDVLLSGTLAGYATGELWENNGNGTFSKQAIPFLTGVDLSAAAWGDFNNDGRLDFIWSGLANTDFFPPVVRLWQNNEGISNAAPSAPTGLSASVSIRSATLSWNASSDATTPAAALTYNLRIGRTPGGNDVVAGMAVTNGLRRIPALGNMQQRRTFQISDLPGSGTYYWAVQAIDHTLAGGAFTESTFQVTAQAPTAITQSATNIGMHSATVRGTVTANQLETLAWFQWGTTTNYGNVSETFNMGSGTSAQSTSKDLLSLASTVTYNYRVVASNVFGITYGTNATFLTRTNTGYEVTAPGDTTTGSSASYPEFESPANAIDNTVATKYLNHDKLNTGFTVKSSGGSRIVRALTLFSSEDPADRDPASFVLSGSLDGSNFVFIASNSVPNFIDRYSFQTFEITNNTSYSDYRLIFPTIRNANATDSMQIGEVELLPYGDMLRNGFSADVNLPSGATVINSTEGLMDRQLAGNRKLRATGVYNNTTVDIVPEGRTVLKGFSIIGASDDIGWAYRTPSSISVAGSNDGTNYVTLSTVTPAQVPTYNFEIQDFPVLTNAASYGFYRVTLGAPQSGILQLGELRLLGILLPSDAKTLPATRVTANAAQFNGTATYVEDTEMWFEYGTTTNYGTVLFTDFSEDVLDDLVDNQENALVSVWINSLLPGTTYHYRLVASNNVGISYGTNYTFTTRAALDLTTALITPSSSNFLDQYQGPLSAVDNDLFNAYRNLDETNTGFTVQVSDSNRVVRSMTLFSALHFFGVNTPELPASYALEGSNNGTNFVTLSSGPVSLSDILMIESFPFTHTNACKYYRVTFPTVRDPDNANAMSIGEVELLPYLEITSTNDTLNLTLPSGASVVSGVSNLVDRAFFGSEDNFIVSSVSNIVIVDVTPAVGRTVLKGFALLGGLIEDEAWPSSVTVQGTDNGTNFTTLTSVTPVAEWTLNQDFPMLTNNTAFNRYRFQLAAPAIGHDIALGELRLFGEEASLIVPHLFIGRSNQQIVLQWDAAANAQLEYKTNLSGGIWLTNTTAPTLNNGTNALTIPMDSGTKFFRLHRP